MQKRGCLVYLNMPKHLFQMVRKFRNGFNSFRSNSANAEYIGYILSYLAFGKLLDEHGDELELFCQFKDDEGHFLKFFRDYPEVL